MNIIVRELKANFKALLIWIGALSIIYFAAASEYSVFVGNEAIVAALNNPTFQMFFQALGVNNIDIMSPEGYVSLVSFYIYLPLAIYSAILGAGIVSKEERDRTAEFMFTLPVTRQFVLTSKLIVSVFYTLLLALWTSGFCYWAFGRIGSSDAFAPFMRNLAVGVLLTQLIFLSVGLLLSSVLKQYKKSGSITLAVLITTFMMSMLTQITDKVDFLKYITPFQYFNVNDMLAGEFVTTSIVLTVIIVVGSITGMYYFYRKRDLYI